MQHREYSFVQVSPDAIAYIQVGDDSKVLASVEAKTLVDHEKIQKAKDIEERTPMRTIVMIIFGLISVAIIVIGDVNLDPTYTLGNIIALINPISWALFWAIGCEHSKANPNLDKWDRLLSLQVGSGIVVCIVGFIAYLINPIDLETTVRPVDWLWYLLLGGIVLPSTHTW